MRIKKGDQVLVVKGKDRGKKAKVLRGFPKKNQVLVEGVNIHKIHRKPRKEGEKGQIVEVPTPIDIAKLRLICPKCGESTRVGYQEKSKVKSQKSKVRICKKCREEI